MPIISENMPIYPAIPERSANAWMIHRLNIEWDRPDMPIKAFVVLMPYNNITGDIFPDDMRNFTLDDIGTLCQTDTELATVFDAIVVLVDRIAKERGVI